MFDKKTLTITIILCAASAFIAFTASSMYFSKDELELKTEVDKDLNYKEENIFEVKDNSDDSGTAVLDNITEIDGMETSVPVSSKEKITPSTKLIYEYFYPDDDVLERQEDVPPYFLVDMTLSDLLTYYSDWEITYFSEKEVIMRKVVEGKSHQRYIIGERDGYVAVFYEEAIDGISLKEVTETPISSLNKEERTRLENGIMVVGEQELIKILENYGS